LFGQPIIIVGHYWGAVVLCLAGHDKKNTQPVLKLMQWGLVWLQFLLHQQTALQQQANKVPEVAESVAHIPQIIESDIVLQLTQSLLKEHSRQEMAISAVNFLATHLVSTRVSLGLINRGKLTLSAVSFSANFDSRSEAMQLLLEAMSEALEQRHELVVNKTSSEPIPAERKKELAASPHSAEEQAVNVGLIRRCHEQLLDRQHLSSANTYLLRKNDEIIGVMTCEFAEKQHLSTRNLAFIAAFLPLLSTIFSLRAQAEAGLFRHLQYVILGKLRGWFGAEKWLAKVLSGFGIAFIVVLFFPATFWIHSDASLQSVYKHLLVSPQDGYLGAIKARPGDRVTKGMLLAQLDDQDLRLERRKIASQIQQYQQEYDNALANSNRVAAAIANAQLDQAVIQRRLIEQQLERTQLVAPSDGIVVSDDISQALGAPVKQGQVLFEVAAAEGYLVQLYVDERDIAAVQLTLNGQLKLTSLPRDIFEFKVIKITPLSEVREGRNYFKVEAELLGAVDLLRPGMTGSGKINGGKHALGWIWFHDIWHWLRLRLWW
jgi:hypothetical protein